MKGKRWFGLLLAFVIMLGSSLNVFLDANAESFPIDSYGVYHTDFVYQDLNCPTWNYTEGYHSSNNATFTACQIYGVLLQTEPVASTGNYWGATFKLNLVAVKNINNPWSNLSSLQVTNASIGDSVNHHTPLTIDNTSIQTYVTKWYHESSFNYRNTLTIQVSVSGHGTGNLTGPMRFLIKTSPDKPFWNQGGSTGFYFEDSGTIPNINFSGNTDDTNSQTIINQNNTMINQNEAIINQNQAIINQNEEDRNNIEQQSSDVENEAETAGGAASQTGQTLMQAFGSLITALTNLHETNCILPNMSVYTLNMNNIDLCAVGLPTGVANLVGIGMCLIIVPLGIHLVKKMIGLYKEMTG